MCVMHGEHRELRAGTSDASDDERRRAHDRVRSLRAPATPSACTGCLVSFVLDREPGDAVIIDADEARALRVLADAGWCPRSRFEATRVLAAAIGRSRRRRDQDAARHERLPAEGGRHPELPRGAVASARPARRSRCSRRARTATRRAYDADALARGPARRARPRLDALRPDARGAARDRRGRSSAFAPGPRALRPLRARSGCSDGGAALPYGVVLHGAEVAIPAQAARACGGSRAPCSRDAAVVVSAGSYPEDEARRLAGDALAAGRAASRPASTRRGSSPSTPTCAAPRATRLGLPDDGPLVVSVGRLVPRKGIDVLIEAVGAVRARGRRRRRSSIAGDGRDATRLRRLAARRRAPTCTFLGRVERGATRSHLLGARRRLRPAVPLEVGRPRAGGVRDRLPRGGRLRGAPGRRPLGRVVRGRGRGRRRGSSSTRRATPRRWPRALATLLGDAGPPSRRWATAARRRAVREFDYDVLARRLADGLEAAVGGRGARPRRRLGAVAREASVTERATETIVVAADPGTVFAVAVDLEDYPEWVADLKSVVVDRARRRGPTARGDVPRRRLRALVHLLAALRLRRRARRSLSWVHGRGRPHLQARRLLPLRAHRRAARSSPTSSRSSCACPIPGFVKQRAAQRIQGTALRELKARAESLA